MFNIDLLNNVGLQKIISRQKINDNANKGNIIFEKSIPDEEINNDDYENPDNDSSNLLSYVIAIISLLLLTVFAFMDYQKIFKTESSDDIIISSLTRLLDEPKTKKMVNYISINEDVKLSLSVDDLDKINLIKSILKEDSYSYKVYEDHEYNYNIEITSKMIAFRKNENKIKNTLASTIEKYKNRTDIEIKKVLKSTSFISNHKTIFSILEEILNLGVIKISLDSNSDFIILEFNY
mgnify:CR=1 FL=1